MFIGLAYNGNPFQIIGQDKGYTADTPSGAYTLEGTRLAGLLAKELPSGTVDRTVYELLYREWRSYNARPDDYGKQAADKIWAVLQLYRDRLD